MPGNAFIKYWKIRNKFGKVIREIENKYMEEVMKS